MNNPIPKFNGPIAVIDILGFKKFVESNSLEFVINSYAHELTSAFSTSDILEEDLQFMVYSDTIALRLVNQTDSGFFNFIKAIHLIISFYFYKCKIQGEIPLPMRGAIAIGDYSWYNGDISTQVFNRKPIFARSVNFIVGKAIIDAHEHEQKQQWIGVSMNDKTTTIIKKHFPVALKQLQEEKYLIEYQIPLKEGKTNGLVVNPTIRAVFKDTFESFLGKCNLIFQDTQEIYKTKLKYYNTMKMLNYIHVNDYLTPVNITFSKEERTKFKVEIDKGNYTDLITYFKNTINSKSTNS